MMIITISLNIQLLWGQGKIGSKTGAGTWVGTTNRSNTKTQRVYIYTIAGAFS